MSIHPQPQDTAWLKHPVPTVQYVGRVCSMGDVGYTLQSRHGLIAATSSINLAHRLSHASMAICFLLSSSIEYCAENI